MPKQKRVARNSKRRTSAKRPVVYLFLTIGVIVLVLFLLEKTRKPRPGKPSVKPPAIGQQAPHGAEKPEVPLHPEKPEIQPAPGKPLHKQYSTPAVVVPAVKPPRVTGPGVVALIVDDMGSNLAELNELMRIGIPMTFSVIPGLAHAEDVAEAAHAKGYEVMLHMPMEPRDYPQRRLESNGLLLAHSDQEIRTRVTGYFRQVPHAVGANNHMGSRFTEDRAKMGIVLAALRDKGMFFVDSMTTPKSVGLALSREIGLPAVTRTAPFIDNSEDVAAIKLQLQALARIAVKRGSAVGICHPHQATIRALAEELPALKLNGIRFVHVSKLVH